MHRFFGLCGRNPMWFDGPVPNSRAVALDALTCWENAAGDVATDSVTWEDEPTDPLADEDAEAICSARGHGGIIDAVT